MRQTTRTIARRPEVQWFSCEMESVLRANDHKGGWHGEDSLSLCLHLRDELKELEDAVDAMNSECASRERYIALSKKVIREAADVGNIAMMVADNSWT